jgi:hypothetical protein
VGRNGEWVNGRMQEILRRFRSSTNRGTFGSAVLELDLAFFLNIKGRYFIVIFISKAFVKYGKKLGGVRFVSHLWSTTYIDLIKPLQLGF